MALGAARARAIAVPVLAEAKARMGLLPTALHDDPRRR